ncbi:hypothetical protein GpartN1_g1831.t1 [Galdieria partita]|uniref:RRM domain-containing protein n=1 Tax=Galdieria partita TaxID=83374 RepID=A0A9C7PTA6_9RHOD|nr:hypothetical protein GpartN1_g1831.t1 [Galdieria partita]
MGDLQQGSTVATAEGLSHISSNYDSIAQAPSLRSLKESPCKIFIGQLPSNVVEEDLRRICEPHGTVLETTIVRNRMTNQSRGCGFCVFHNGEEAHNAIQALHGTKPFPSGSKPLQVRLAEKNSDFSDTKLYIGHLEPFIEEEQLRNAFTKFGEIVDINIVRPRNNVDSQNNAPFNYGFVEFSSSEAADNAILSAKNGQVWLDNGKPLTEVRYARLSRNNRYVRNSDGYYKERGIPESMLYDPNLALESWPGMDTSALSSPAMMPSTSYFPFNYFPFSNHVASPMMDTNGNEVNALKSSDNEEGGNVPEGFVNQANLVNYFPYGMYPSGPALSAVWNPEYGDPKTQYNSANWFPSMYPYSPEYAEYLAAAAGANAPSFETQQNRVRGPSECNLFVYGIPPDWDDAMLANLFLPFGKLLSSNVFIDKRTQRSKGFGFVSYAYPDSAHMAIAMLNGMTLPNGRTLKVSLKKDKNDNNSE